MRTIDLIYTSALLPPAPLPHAPQGHQPTPPTSSHGGRRWTRSLEASSQWSRCSQARARHRADASAWAPAGAASATSEERASGVSGGQGCRSAGLEAAATKGTETSVFCPAPLTSTIVGLIVEVLNMLTIKKQQQQQQLQFQAAAAANRTTAPPPPAPWPPR